jgi:hypothetical protein
LAGHPGFAASRGIEDSDISGKISCACAATCTEASLAILNPRSDILLGCQADIRFRIGELPQPAGVHVVAAWDSRGNPADPTADLSTRVG